MKYEFAEDMQSRMEEIVGVVVVKRVRRKRKTKK